MKRITIAVLLGLLLASVSWAQNDYTTTPNLALKLPKLGSTNFGIYINQDFTTLDSVLGQFHGGFVTVPASATPTYDLTKGNTFQLTMTSNVTSSTVNQPGVTAGQFLYLILCQNGTGGFTNTFPSNFQTPYPTVTLTPSNCSASTWVWSASFAKWINISGTGGGGGGGGTPTPPANSLQYDNAGAFGAASLLFYPAHNPCSYLSVNCDDYIMPSGAVCLSATGAADANITFGNIFNVCNDAANAVNNGVSGTQLGANATSRPPAVRALPASWLAVALGAGSNATGNESNVSDDPLDASAGPASMWAFETLLSLTRATGSIGDMEGLIVRSPFNLATAGAPAAETVGTLYGVHVQDLLAKGTTRTAALDIDTQTAGANVFAIKVDGGKSEFDGGTASPFYSSTAANHAQSGVIQVASVEGAVAWRNNANTADLQLAKTGPALGQIPSDTVFLTGNGCGTTNPCAINAVFIGSSDSSSSVAASGSFRMDTADKMCWRNNANTNDVCISKNNSDILVWPNSASVGGTTLAGSSGGTSTFPNNTGTVAELNLAQTWTANQSIANGSSIRWFSTNGTNYAGFTGGASTTNLVWLFPTTDSTGTQCLSSNGSLQLSWSTCSAGTGTPGGSTTQVQYNAAGSFGGSTNLTWVSPTLTIGVNGTATGQLALATVTGGGASVVVQNPSATSTYNFNLPTGAGTFGQPLLSGGGGSTAMSFGTLSVGGGGTGATSFTSNQLVVGGASLSSLAGTLTGTNPVLTLTSASASNVPFALNTPASPTADIMDISINGSKTSWFDNLAVLHTPSTTYNGSGPLVMSGSLGTCPSPIASTAILCLGDLSSGVAQLSNNGASFKPVTVFTNTAPTFHGVVLATPTFPQVSTTGAGTSGQPLISGGASADPAYGTLSVAGGGTGDVTLTAHGVLLGEGTSAINASAAGTSGQPFLSGGASADGAYGALALGSTAVSGVLATANGGTGASSLSGASIATVTGVITANDCVKFSSGTVITDAGAPCGGSGGATALSALTPGTASNTINSTTFPQTWNWALTGSTTAFKRGENSAATGSSNILDQVSTLASSTAVVAQWDNNGNGYQVNPTGLLRPVGSGAFATPGSAHNLVVSQAGSAAVTYVPPVAAGKVLIDNGPGNDPSFQDPIISQAYVNLFNAVAATGTATSSAVRNPIFSQTGTLQLTWASITGSPATCTLQIQGVDSLGNALNDGSTVSVSPANGTTSQQFNATAGLLTAAQVKVIYACGTYPSTGTFSLDFTPILTVATLPPANASTNLAQVGGSSLALGQTTMSASVPVAIASNQSNLPVVGAPTTSSSNAATPFHNAAITTATTVKSSAGNLYGWYVYNPNASTCYLEFFNTTSVTLGTTTVVFSMGIPATGAANVPPGFTAVSNFSTAIAIAGTTTDGGSSTCGSGMSVNLWVQ